MKITQLVQAIDEAAHRLGLTPDAVRGRCLLGSLPCVKILGRWRIPDRSGIAMRLWKKLHDELTAVQVGQILGIKQQGFDRLLTSGAFPTHLGGEDMVVSKAKLMEFLGLNRPRSDT